MNAELGTPVSTSDGHGIGSIDAVIVGRTTGRVRAVTVREGFVVHHRIRLPLEDLFAGIEDDLRCDVAAADAASLPRFHASEIPDELIAVQGPPSSPVAGRQAVATEASSRGDGHAPVESSELSEMVRQADADNAVVGIGARVVGRDGSRLGRVERVTFDLRTGELGSVTFRGGFLGTAELAVPASHIVTVDDGEIVLDVSRDRLDALSVRPD